MQFRSVENKNRKPQENRSPGKTIGSTSRGTTMRYPSIQNPFCSQRKDGFVPKYIKLISNQPSYKVIKPIHDAATFRPRK